MARRKKSEIEAEQTVMTPVQRFNAMRNGRIDKEYLSDLIMEYKFKRSLDVTFPMPRELAQIVLLIIDKTLGNFRWRSYTEDWKEDMKGKAIEHVLRYVHNYDSVKSLESSQNNDPYYYIGMIVTNAFIQSWKKSNERSKCMMPLNDEILYQFDNSEEFNHTLNQVKWYGNLGE
jgi:hypothetical protein